MKYSIIILMEKEHKDFPQFVKNLHDIFTDRQVPFEIFIVVIKGSSIWRKQIAELHNLDHRLKVIEFNRPIPQAVCLKATLKETNGNVIAVFGYYQQITNDSLSKLIDSLEDGTDIISPWRQGRVDHWFKSFQSKLFNTLVRKITSHEIHDLSCTVKIFRREVLEDTEIYGNMYRYLPIVAARKGFKTKEVKCQHYQEPFEHVFFSLSDYLTRLIDIFTLYFNTQFTKKPLRFFSFIGLGFLLIGFCVTSYIFTQKFILGYPIGDRLILLVAIFCMVLGVQVSSVGLLGEIIVFIHGRRKKEYTVEKKI